MLGKRPREEAEAATEAPQVQVPALLQGEYSNKFIRVGEEWQALVPDVNATSAISEARADQLDPLSDYVPLKEAPPPLPHPSHDFSAAAAAAAKAAADAWAESHKPVPNPFTDVFGDDEGDLSDYDEDDNLLMPDGVVVGGDCLAMGCVAGERRPLRGKLVSVRKISPHLLVKFVSDMHGSKSRLLLPEVLKAFLHRKEVRPWVSPDEPPAGGAGVAEANAAYGGDSAAASSSAAVVTDGGASLCKWEHRHARTLRARPEKPNLAPLMSELGGLRLHLDPRRTNDNYAGTGYKGVFDDYWPTGYKKERPYTVVDDGKYHGRFATVLQAAVHFARLEAGLPSDVGAVEQRGAAEEVAGPDAGSVEPGSALTEAGAAKVHTAAVVEANTAAEAMAASTGAVEAVAAAQETARDAIVMETDAASVQDVGTKAGATASSIPPPMLELGDGAEGKGAVMSWHQASSIPPPMLELGDGAEGAGMVMSWEGAELVEPTETGTIKASEEEIAPAAMVIETEATAREVDATAREVDAAALAAAAVDAAIKAHVAAKSAAKLQTHDKMGVEGLPSTSL